MNKRYALLLALATMPDEAFGWFAVWAQGNLIQYPEALGGFTPESREAITRFREEASNYLDYATEN